MIEQIYKPDINFNINIIKGDKYYFDNINNYYIIKNNNETHYFNLNGARHRLDGIASNYGKTYSLYYINNINYEISKFNKITNHLLCKWCDTYCKQNCF